MPNYKAITKSEFATLSWKRHNNYQFAALDTAAPLVLQELPKACMSLPVCFTEHGDGFMPAALLGLSAGKNLYVAPGGKWLAPYVPAAYRGYPFALAATEGKKVVLCADMESDLIGENHAESFFDESGEVSQSITKVLDFLNQVRADRERTERVCKLLQQHGLVVPWEVGVKGAYRVDEQKFNGVDADTLASLQKGGALPLIYCQLLSMQHAQTLAKLAEAHAKNEAKALANSNGELNLDFLSDSGSLNFGPH